MSPRLNSQPSAPISIAPCECDRGRRDNLIHPFVTWVSAGSS